MAGAVIAGLTNNPALPAPTVDLKTVQTAADELDAALTAQAHGGKAWRVHKPLAANPGLPKFAF